MAVVGADTQQTQTEVATDDLSLLGEILEVREAPAETSTRDPRLMVV